ncbi:steroid 5-alpha-reductase det2 [Anaeramoeba ignava]|uniref:Steroid 5-alpha-reductase det2 n=1 Tax=Anaeramoeba ignava TaxID=1746090 RepID=A0A9Q0M094_ANAIG|nr:steroid 5-alpha-reductase det2 [Anaeramoeba ignava]
MINFFEKFTTFLLENYHTITLFFFFSGLIIFLILLVIPAYYGRYTQTTRKFLMFPNKIAWIVMEVISPISLLIGISMIQNFSKFSFKFNYLEIIYLSHYIYRSLIFPLLISPSKKSSKVAFEIMLMAIVFNSFNGILNGIALQTKTVIYQNFFLDLFKNPLSFLGLILIVSGFSVNFLADRHLISLRSDGSTRYKIPTWFVFEYVTSANYFGEIVEWFGFWVASRTLAAFVFFCWTCFNLIPRAITHHRWYHEHFEEYPKSRKIVIPFIF